MSALPLVLLHGWGAHAGVWGDLISRMDLGHQVIAPDLAPEGAPMASREDVIEQIAASVPERCVVAGWSLGGQLALAWAHRHPQQVARVLLIASTPRFVAEAGWPHGMDAATFAGFSAEVAADSAAALRRFLLLQTQGDRAARTVARSLDAALNTRALPERDVLLQMLGWLQDTDLRPHLAQIRQRVLLVHGDCDRITPSGAAEYMARHLPDARLECIPGAAHAPFMSAPDVLGRMVSEFCNE